ncbi:MAG: alpha/beta family hydrolase [Dehalococcoidia bacterium]
MPDGPLGEFIFIYAPGAGSNVNDGFGSHLSHTLGAKGISSVRFQFPYMEARRRRPDSRPVLEDTWRSVIKEVGAKGLKLVIGGRSMGGRIASQVVAQGVEAEALALFAYPLHPPGKPSQWRDEHLPDINVPTLFCSGTRDTFATPEELETVAARIPDATVHILNGADHGFSVLKSSDRTRQDIWDEAIGVLLNWMDNLD